MALIADPIPPLTLQVTINELSAAWFTNAKSLAAWFKTCSYDTVALVPGEDNKVVQVGEWEGKRVRARW